MSTPSLFHRLSAATDSDRPRIENAIARENLGLVRKSAHRYAKTSWLSYDELYQHGCIGLTKAIRQFDPSLGNQFSSFAVPKINGEIMHAIRDSHQGGVKVPRQYREHRQTIRNIHRRLNRPDLSVEQVAIAFFQQRGLTQSQSQQRWQEIEAACAKKSFEELPELPSTHNSDRTYAVRSLLARMPWPIGTILLFHHSGVSDEAIASRYNLTLEQVSAIITDGTERLRACA